MQCQRAVLWSADMARRSGTDLNNDTDNDTDPTRGLTPTQTDADATLQSRDRRKSLSIAAHARLRALLLSDSFLFARRICKHLDLIPAIHMPLSYLACGLTDRLIETLDMPGLDSYLTRKLRAEFERRLSQQFGPTPWRTAAGRNAIDALINGTMMRPAIVNIRMFRRLFKSSVITHAGTLFIGTVDPNETIKITHAVDPKAWEFCEQIGATINSGIYHDYFPDRIPHGDLTRLITQKRITLGGRTISHPQTTIQASGYNTKEEAAHYSVFVTDDLVTDLNSSPGELREVLKYMKRMTGYYMPTRRIRRLEVGTKHDEDDDDTFLTTGDRIEHCLTLRMPIEEHSYRVTNILERGKPTCPELFPAERITIEQTHVLSGDADEDGYRVWWNQYLLSATGGTLRLFPADVVDDPDYWWMGPYEHPNANWSKRGHYLIARWRRDGNGKLVPKRDHTLYAGDELVTDWRKHAELLSFDPWQEMDRVLLVDPSWSDREQSDNWAVSCVGQDYDNVKCQLQTLSDTTGMEGWISALDYLDSIWQPRAWGIDATASQDPMIENTIRTDKRLRKMASRMVKLHHTQRSKGSRMMEGLAQPLLCHRFLLAPPYREQNVDKFGGNITRSELKMIKSTPKHAVSTDQDGIADSLAMSGSVLRSVRKSIPPEPQRPTVIDPVLGVPIAEAAEDINTVLVR